MKYFLIFAVAVLRVLPHPPNFAPISSIALFGGAHLGKKFAFLVPLVAMLISDFFIGFYDFRIMLSVYVSFIITGIIGLWLKNKINFSRVVGASLASSLVFFTLTNGAVWAFSPLYEKTADGFISCFILALPFFRNTLMGDLFYVGLMFGGYALVKKYYLAGQEKTALTKN